MKSFKEFLHEDTQRYIWGINHTDARANEEIIKLAQLMGYEIVEGGKHIKIMNPVTGRQATAVSRGGGSDPYANRMALTQLLSDQLGMGGFARDFSFKEIKKAMAANPKASGLRAIGAAGLATAAGVAGGALSQGVEAATNVVGGLLTPPAPKDRMFGEKTFNSDVGLAFDLTPDGELEASPAGMKAVRDRQAKGVSFSTLYPENLYK